MNPKAAQGETYPHIHAGENCPCADTSGTVVAMRRVPGFQVVENHYPSGLELTSHPTSMPCVAGQTLRGVIAETRQLSARRVSGYLPRNRFIRMCLTTALLVSGGTGALKRGGARRRRSAGRNPGHRTWLAQGCIMSSAGDGLAVSLEEFCWRCWRRARHSGRTAWR
jgi:hypothetical protein